MGAFDKKDKKSVSVYTPAEVLAMTEKIKKGMTEETVMCSRGYLRYFTNTAQMITGKDIKVIFDINAPTAYTDSKKIVINPILTITKGLTFSEKTLINLGFAAHEIFHILFTDFSILHKAVKNPWKWKYFKMLKDINNIIEDSCIELFGTNYYEGDFKVAVIFLNETIFKVSKEINLISGALNKIICAMSQFGSCGKVKGVIPKKIKEYWKEIKPLMVEARHSEDCQRRWDISEEIYKILLPLVEEEHEKYKEQSKTDNFASNPSDEITNRETVEVEVTSDFQEDMKDKKKSKKGSGKKTEESKEEEGETKEKESTSDKGTPGSNKDKTSDKSSSKDISSDDTDLGDTLDNDEKSSDTSGSTTDKETDDKGSESSKSEEDKKSSLESKIKEKLSSLERDIEKISDEAVKENTEDMLEHEKAEKTKEIMDIDFGNIHNRIKNKIQYFNSSSITDENIEEYEKYVEKHNETISLLTSKIKRILKFAKDDMLKGEKMGVFSPSSTTRIFTDKRVFQRAKENSKSSIAFEILVDESGSMAHGNRIPAAIESCVVFTEVCKRLDIPLAIIGFTALFHQNKALHQHFIDFDSPDRFKYNIMNLKALWDNRDGYSVKYAGEYLLKRTTADKKVLIVISDGEPCHNADEYWENKGGKDLIDNIQKLEKKCKVIGLNIGGTEVNLEQFYQTCINIPEMDLLPDKLLGILKKYFK